VARGIEALLEETRYSDFIEMENRGDPLGAEVRKNGVRALVEAAEQFDSQGEGGLEGFLEMLALDNRKDEESEEFGMTLLTVHSAKGLEFPVVCIVGVEEETFPHRNSLGLEDGIDTIDEERRLFYVAMTRAKQRLILSSAAKRTRFGKEMPRIESRFIAEIGEERLEILDAASEEPVDSATADDFLLQLRNIVGGSESS
jgi:DNA helicase-2/ATP-dependent DNA helicase PcrA